MLKAVDYHAYFSIYLRKGDKNNSDFSHVHAAIKSELLGIVLYGYMISGSCMRWSLYRDAYS